MSAAGSCYVVEEGKATEIPPWDINEDGRIDILDLIVVSQYFGQQIAPATKPDPDLNDDGEVSALDLMILVQHFGETTGLAALPVD